MTNSVSQAKAHGAKGLEFEELLRSYFLRSGHFVLRGVPFRVAGDDVTDIDLWLYERPTGASRRVLIVDAKFKSKPKAAERMLWTRGLAETLGADGAFVATTDSRASLKAMASRIGVTLLDGSDLIRLGQSSKVAYPDRITEEDLVSLITIIDRKRSSKEFYNTYHSTKSVVIGGLGASGTIRSLEAVRFYSEQGIVSHPNSDLASVAGRLTYLCASIAAINLDFLSVESPFRPASERKEMLANAIRYGNSGGIASLERLKLAVALVSRFAEGGDHIARSVETRYLEELSAIPADIIAEQVSKMTSDDTLVSVAKELEAAAYARILPNFDQLSLNAKSYLGAALDFNGVARAKFAESWGNSSQLALSS